MTCLTSGGMAVGLRVSSSISTMVDIATAAHTSSLNTACTNLSELFPKDSRAVPTIAHSRIVHLQPEESIDKCTITKVLDCAGYRPAPIEQKRHSPCFKQGSEDHVVDVSQTVNIAVP